MAILLHAPAPAIRMAEGLGARDSDAGHLLPCRAGFIINILTELTIPSTVIDDAEIVSPFNGATISTPRVEIASTATDAVSVIVPPGTVAVRV